MSHRVLLGIDAGGTHTDGVIIEAVNNTWTVKCEAKVQTRHHDLPSSIRDVLSSLAKKDETLLAQVSSVTLGTTLAVNALVQGKTEKVGLVLSAGPGLAPERFAMGEYVAVLPGGLDHRGVEVSRLSTEKLAPILARWKKEGVQEIACVGKFSPRSPLHEEKMAEACAPLGFRVSMGHRLSGQLNFPRRIATAWFNASVGTIHNNFLSAVESAMKEFGIHAPIRLLKADGGAVPIELSRQEPVQSILSGPAASVMGVLALARETDHGCSLLLDCGGTTTDIAVIIDGSPVIDRDGMLLQGRRTLVRALASVSIGVGGDSRISVSEDEAKAVSTGPIRTGNAMAFGGSDPTLLDALNFLNTDQHESGDRAKSRAGLIQLAEKHGLRPESLAEQAVGFALDTIREASNRLLRQINEHPIYTLRALRAHSAVSPERILLVGGPAHSLKQRLENLFALPVLIPEASDVANAVGAALTRPTARLDVYADTGRRELRAPSLAHTEVLPRSATLNQVKERALALLSEHLASNGVHDAEVEVVEADLFATLDNYGSSSRDMRVTCQAVPGISGRASHADRAL